MTESVQQKLTAILLTLSVAGVGHAQTRAQFEQARHKLVSEILEPAGLTWRTLASVLAASLLWCSIAISCGRT